MLHFCLGGGSFVFFKATSRSQKEKVSYSLGSSCVSLKGEANLDASTAQSNKQHNDKDAHP